MSSQGIYLIVRADDMGSTHTANVACLQCYEKGIVRSVEVMVPAPWYPEAVLLLQQHPSLDVGVHLTLTSEWDRYKWRPLTHAPSLCDSRGYLRQKTSQLPEDPPGTGFLQSEFRLEEVETELRAQIETALRDIPQVSHLSCHMFTAVATPPLRQLTERLAREYGLRLEDEGLQFVEPLGGAEVDAEGKEQKLLSLLDGLTPGKWLLVDHPGLDTLEMRALGHRGYEQVAFDRAGVTYAFTSPRVQKQIKQRSIMLISYADLARLE